MKFSYYIYNILTSFPFVPRQVIFLQFVIKRTFPHLKMAQSMMKDLSVAERQPAMGKPLLH